MTASIATTESAALASKVRDLEVNGALNWDGILELLGTEPEQVETNLPAVRKAPKPVHVSDAQTKAIASALEKVNALKWDVQGELSRGQREDVVEVAVLLALAESVVKKARAELRTMVLNDGDARLEAAGAVNEHTPRDKDGHYLVGDEDGFSVPGQEKKLRRNVTGRKAVLLAEDVKDLVEAEEIPAAVYRKVVKIVRVVDEDAMWAEVAKKPALAEKLASKVRTKGGALSVTVSPNTTA